MIKNDKQLAITKGKRAAFQKALEALPVEDVLAHELMYNSITSQIETLDEEIKIYEKLRNEHLQVIETKIEDLPEQLITTRIAKGLSQSELAEKMGLKEQQIQRYEASNYEAAKFDRIIEIFHMMGVTIESVKLVLSNDPIIKLESYDTEFIAVETKRLQSRKSLFTV